MSNLHPIFQQALAPWMPKPLTTAQQWHQRNDDAALKLQIKEQQCSTSS